MAEIIIFEHRDLRGAHRHIFDAEPNFDAPDDNFFNDRMSSFVVVSGVWQFYLHRDYVSPIGREVGPGVYRWVEDFWSAQPNDQASSVRCVQ